MADSRRIIEVYCNKCGQFLIGTIPGSWTFCPACQTWTQAETKEKVNKCS